MPISSKVLIDLIQRDDVSAPSDNLDRVIGQTEVVKKFKFFLQSHSPGMVFPTMLFSGSHGLGKTYFAKIIAENLSRRFIEINCGTLTSTKEFVESVLLDKVMGDRPITILLDEAHRLSSEVSTILLTLLSVSSKKKNVFEYRGVGINYDMSRINTIIATTDSFKIFPPLVNRCEKIYFRPYLNEDLIKMLMFYLPGISIDPLISIDEIAYACRGRGRDTFQLSEKIKRHCDKNGRSVFTKSDWDLIKGIFGIYPMGLNEQELMLMRIIRVEGTISCANIAARMMVGEENVSEEIEIRPRELWLIENISKGRILTEKGNEYFDSFLKEDIKTSELKIMG